MNENFHWLMNSTSVGLRQICSFVPRVKYGSGCLHLLSCPALFRVLHSFRSFSRIPEVLLCVGSVRRFQLRSLMVYYLYLSQDASADFCFVCSFLLCVIYLVLQNSRIAHGYYTTGLAWVWFKVSKSASTAGVIIDPKLSVCQEEPISQNRYFSQK